ncbi:MAG TPA: hypothetical protein DEQ34_14875 [Balneolaceae bacterium]|nr:hypothetical protein [Balneolaceae bacterium]|tara:strand:+ start:101669 stop:101875 length:207 start_codon:yes stop_codon:yes gene_type:complete
MPIMDGWDVLNEFESLSKELPKEIRIYVVTSSVDHEDYKKLKQYKTVKDYFVKPIDRFTVNEILSEVA